MEGKYSLSDIVIFKNRLYEIVQAHPLNWFMEYEPIVYGLITWGETLPTDRGVEIYVREGLLRLATPKEIQTWRLLYEKRGSSRND